MKKWMVASVGLIIISFFSIYYFSPANIAISRIIISNSTINGEIRFLSTEYGWESWWRDKNGHPHKKDSLFTYDGMNCRLISQESNAVNIQIEYKGLEVKSIINLVSLKTDSTAAIWQCEIPAGMNLVKRIVRYRISNQVSEKMKEILTNLNRFVSDTKNIYGLDIQRGSIQDTLLFSGKFKSLTYPSSQEIYRWISILKEDIKKQKVNITGFPLINIRKTDAEGYETQVALPTNIWLKDTGPFFSRRMVPGNFMITEVRGGQYSVERAKDQMEKYISDYNKTMMAIPFQCLITDRMNEPDTVKWITRLYSPVMN